MSTPLPLRDVHLPPAPGLWPPAPGWWLVAAVLLVLLALPLLLRWRRHQRERVLQQQFDRELATGADGPLRLAAIVGLLRRAARERRRGDELLQGEAWLHLLDPHEALPPAQRRLLLDGAYQPRLDAAQLDAVERWARGRYTSLLQGRRP